MNVYRMGLSWLTVLLLISCTDMGRMYRHSAHNFAVQLPSGWFAAEQYLGSDLYLSPPAGQASALRYISINANPVNADTGGKGQGLGTYVAFREGQVHRFASNYQTLARERQTLADKEAERILASVKMGSQRSIHLTYYVVAQGVGYSLSAVLAPNYSDADLRRAERSLRSFSPG